MDFEEFGKRLRLAGFFLAICGALYVASQTRKAQERVHQALEESEQGGAPAPPRFPRLAAIDEAGYAGRVDEALALCRKVLAEPQDAAEKTEAEKKLPQMLARAHEAAGKKEDWDGADRLRGELTALGQPAQDQLRWAQRHRGDWAWRVLDKREGPAIERLLPPLLSEPMPAGEIDLHRLAQAYRDYRLSLWKEALARGDKEGARLHFIAAAAAFPNPQKLAERLREWPRPDLIPAGKAFMAEKHYAAALAYLTAANEAFDLSGGQRQVLPDLVDRCWMGLAEEAEAAGRTGSDDLGSALQYYQRVSGLSLASKAKERLGKLFFDLAESSVQAQRYPAADSFYQQAIQMAQERWSSQAYAPGGDPWLGFDPALAALLKKAHAQSDPTVRLNALSALVRDGSAASPLLEVRRIQERQPEFRARWGLSLLANEFDRAEGMLRPLLRDPATAAQRPLIGQGLRDAFLKAQSAKDIGRLAQTAGFYIGELGAPKPGEPFYTELLGGLESTAKEFEGQSTNKRVFVLTLLAEAFPDTEAGKAAQLEAVAKGLEVAGRGGGTTQPAKVLEPSGLPGLSVITIENSTSHHILVFYDGPERFFLRLNPYRRGSAVLQDGAYATGVLATADEILPYRAQAVFASGRTESRYIIERRSGGKTVSETAMASSGPYALLRAPAGTGLLRVDPNSGRVFSPGKN